MAFLLEIHIRHMRDNNDLEKNIGGRRRTSNEALDEDNIFYIATISSQHKCTGLQSVIHVEDLSQIQMRTP